MGILSQDSVMALTGSIFPVKLIGSTRYKIHTYIGERYVHILISD